jgi:uncharacterized protein YunC (DUF1805 family)
MLNLLNKCKIYNYNILKKPLIIIKAPKGVMACAYLNIETANITKEAIAIFSGVSNHEDILNAKVVDFSSEASMKGIKKGMLGIDVLQKFQ